MSKRKPPKRVVVLSDSEGDDDSDGDETLADIVDLISSGGSSLSNSKKRKSTSSETNNTSSSSKKKKRGSGESSLSSSSSSQEASNQSSKSQKTSSKKRQSSQHQNQNQNQIEVKAKEEFIISKKRPCTSDFSYGGQKEGWKTDVSLETLGITDCIAVKEMDADEAMKNIELTICNAALQILGNNGLCYNVPSRTAANQRYVPELDRIVLHAINTKLNFTSQSSTRKATIYTRARTCS